MKMKGDGIVISFTYDFNNSNLKDEHKNSLNPLSRDRNITTQFLSDLHI